MSLENDGKRKLAEYFWMEINKAILTSPEVKLSIKQLQVLGLLDYVSEYNLVLEVDRLIDKIVKEADDVTPDELTQLKNDFQEVEESGQVDFSQSQKSSKKTMFKEKTDSEETSEPDKSIPYTREIGKEILSMIKNKSNKNGR